MDQVGRPGVKAGYGRWAGMMTLLVAAILLLSLLSDDVWISLLRMDAN
jgi:hypothetical protein